MVIKAKRSLNREFYCELKERISFCSNVGTNSVTSGHRDKHPKSRTVPPRSGRLACMSCLSKGRQIIWVVLRTKELNANA